MINGQKVVKVFCHEEKAVEEFDKRNSELCEAATSANTFANILMPVMGNLGFASTTFSDADFCGVGIVMGNIAKIVSGTPLLIVCVVLFAAPIVYNFVAPKKNK